MFIRLIVEQPYGFDVLKDYSMSQVWPAALVSLLKEGQVDAIFNFESFASEAMVATDSRYLLQAHQACSQENDDFAPWITNMVVHEDWLKQSPARAYAVRDAYDEALRKPYIREKLGITSDTVLDRLSANGTAYDYFTTDWSGEKRTAAAAFLQKLVKTGEVPEVPNGMMVSLEDFIGPRP